MRIARYAGAFGMILAVKFSAAAVCTVNTAANLTECPAGATDLTTAISTAPLGRTVRLSAGTFTVSSGINNSNHSIIVEGAGLNQTTIVFTTASYGFDLTGHKITLRNMTLTRQTDHTQSGVGVELNGEYQLVENVAVSRFRSGIEIQFAASRITIRNCDLSGNNYGLDASSGISRDLKILDTRFFCNREFGILLRSNFTGHNTLIERCEIRQNGRSGIEIEGGLGITISKCHFAHNEWEPTSNEQVSEDSHIRFWPSNSNNPVRHFAIRDNSFYNSYPSGGTWGAVQVNPNKYNNRFNAAYKYMRPWRFVLMAHYDAGKLQYSGNYYWGWDDQTSDAHVCTMSFSCYPS